MENKRETLTRLYDAAQPIGVAYLLAIVTLGHMTVKELRTLTRDSEPTVNKTLGELETRGLVQRAGSGHADKWFPTPVAALVFHQKLFGVVSSSSDLIRSNNSDQDQIKSDEDEQHPNFLGETILNAQPDRAALPAPAAARDEETEREYRVKVYLADRHYGLTGEKRAAYVEDDSIFAIEFETWLIQVADMKRAGAKIGHPAAYALKCCARGDKARPEFDERADRELALKVKYYDPDEKGVINRE